MVDKKATVRKTKWKKGGNQKTKEQPQERQTNKRALRQKSNYERHEVVKKKYLVNKRTTAKGKEQIKETRSRQKSNCKRE